MNPIFWRGKRVFLTGHTGFKGSWLALWLEQLGARVTGYALPAATQPSLYELARVEAGLCAVEGDLADLERLERAVASAQPEIVLHLGAQALVRDSYLHPLETFAANVMGTAHLLEAMRRNGQARAVVVVTSDKCYENREWYWGYRENEAMGGHDPYSSSKGCAELVTAAYRSSFLATGTTAVATARAGNVIGGGDWASDRLIPDMLRAISAGKPVEIRNPNAIRPWQHVLEPLGGYLALAERLHVHGQSYAEAWNFGPRDSDARPVSWIVNHLCQRLDNAAWRVDDGPHPHEAAWLKLDCSKAAARLNWQPRWNLEQALDRIVDWHGAHLRGADMRAFTLAQIEEYTATAVEKASPRFSIATPKET